MMIKTQCILLVIFFLGVSIGFGDIVVKVPFDGRIEGVALSPDGNEDLVAFRLTGISFESVEAVYASADLVNWSPLDRDAISRDESGIRVEMSAPGDNVFIRIRTTDTYAAEGFAYVPPGTFVSGLTMEERAPEETVTFGVPEAAEVAKPFLIGTREVTWSEWNEVRNWALSRGYSDIGPGMSGSGQENNPDWPVANILWSDAVKWCNAKSEMDGLEPLYHLSREFKSEDVYRSEVEYFQQIAFRKDAVGYRLPTDLEWEYACRAGSEMATYAGNITEWDDSVLDPVLDSIAWYAANSGGTTHRVGEKQPNRLGLYDMLGNVRELCEERYPNAWSTSEVGGEWKYTYEFTGFGGQISAIRGGSYADSAELLRSGERDTTYLDTANPVTDLGLRIVINVPGPVAVAGEDRVHFVENGVVPSVVLDGSRSYSASDHEIVSWIWSWEGGGAEGAMVEADFPEGQTEVSLTVEDERGRSDSVSFLVIVLEPMVRIAAGTFMMGPAPDDFLGQANEVYRQVTLSNGFDIGTTEVTYAEWIRVRNWAVSNGYTDLPAGIPGSGVNDHPALPVAGISWRDAIQWCNAKSEMEGRQPYYYDEDNQIYRRTRSWPPKDIYVTGSTGYRLPTEAEWEYACRAGTTTPYWTGDGWTGSDRKTVNLYTGWYSGSSHKSPHVVANGWPNPWGLYDISGNLLEWVWDLYGVPPDESVTDPALLIARSQGGIPDATLRGGGVLSGLSQLRSARRIGNNSASRFVDVGFRVAANVNPNPCTAPDAQAFMNDQYGFINYLGRGIEYLSETRFRSTAYSPAENGNWSLRRESNCSRIVVEFTVDRYNNDPGRYLERHTLDFDTPLSGTVTFEGFVNDRREYYSQDQFSLISSYQIIIDL